MVDLIPLLYPDRIPCKNKTWLLIVVTTPNKLKQQVQASPWRGCQ
jgi:hypothetical protein